MKLKYSMHNGYVPSLNFEDYNFAYSHRFILIIGKKEQVTSVKGRFHATTAKQKKWKRMNVNFNRQSALYHILVLCPDKVILIPHYHYIVKPLVNVSAVNLT